MLSVNQFPSYPGGGNRLPSHAPVSFRQLPTGNKRPLSVPSGTPLFGSGENDAGAAVNVTIDTSIPIVVAGQGDEKKAMLGYQDLIFVRSLNGRQNAYEKRRMIPGWHEEFNKNSLAPSEARNLSMLNYHLTTPEARKTFGSQLSAHSLLDTWRWLGVQAHQETEIDWKDGSGVIKLKVDTAQLTMTWNIWENPDDDCPVEMGDHCYLLCVRKPYQPIAQQLYTSIQDLDDFDKKEYCWNFIPYHQREYGSPPLAKYTGIDQDGNEWVGGYIHIMRMQFFYGTGSGTARIQGSTAITNFLNPTELSDTYKESKKFVTKCQGMLRNKA